jgi:hypothetical protein
LTSSSSISAGQRVRRISHRVPISTQPSSLIKPIDRASSVGAPRRKLERAGVRFAGSVLNRHATHPGVHQEML